MKKSEELMLLLAANKMNVSTYQLRKQLSFEIAHPNTLLFNASLEELFRLKYGKNKADLYQLKNPLMYHHTWPKEIKSIGQFYVQTKDSNRLVSIDEITHHPAYKGAGLKRILQDIFAKYLEEYNTAFLQMLKRLKKLYFLVPKNELNLLKNFRKKFAISIIFIFIILAIFSLPNQTFFSHKIISEYIYPVFINSSFIDLIILTVGRLSLLVLFTYILIYYAFKWLIKDVQKMQIIHRNFDEDNVVEQHRNHIEKMMLNIQLYIEKIEDKNKQDFPLLETLNFEQKELRNYIKNLYIIHNKNDRLQRQKSFFIKALNLLYFIAFGLSIIFLISMGIQVLFGVIYNV